MRASSNQPPPAAQPRSSNVAGRTLIVLNVSWPVDVFQSAAAHEIAHVWLGHPQTDFGNEAETHEDEAAAQGRNWGFTGLGSLPYEERP
jgi:hypothetical protein